MSPSKDDRQIAKLLNPAHLASGSDRKTTYSICIMQLKPRDSVPYQNNDFRLLRHVIILEFPIKKVSNLHISTSGCRQEPKELKNVPLVFV